MMEWTYLIAMPLTISGHIDGAACWKQPPVRCLAVTGGWLYQVYDAAKSDWAPAFFVPAKP